MSASSSVASNSLLRPRTTVLLLTTLAAACSIYFLHSSAEEEEDALSPVPGPGLHRSNAVHRRRRRRRNNADNRDDTDSTLAEEGSAENEDDHNAIAAGLADGETMVDDLEYQRDFDWGPEHTRAQSERAGANIVSLLFRVSEDATKRNAYVHRGISCNSCSALPIRGIRYRCANCADFDLCETCEAVGAPEHPKTHIFYKIRVPASSFGDSRNLQPVWYSGNPDNGITQLPSKEFLGNLSRATGFERSDLDSYWEQWTFMANTEWRDDPDGINFALDRAAFDRCLSPGNGRRHGVPSLMHNQMFAFYDTNNDGLIGFAEFVHALAYRKKKDKWSKIFEAYDIDRDGYVDRKDFLRIFRSFYVFYREAQRDLMEGSADETTNLARAHNLINNRQPLSSFFAPNGQFPATGSDFRTGEGKTLQPSGELEISDGRGVTTESGDDRGSRDSIFRRWRPTPNARNGWNNASSNNNMAYWDAMLNPPDTIEELSQLLNRHRQAGRIGPPVEQNPDPLREHNLGDGAPEEQRGDRMGDGDGRGENEDRAEASQRPGHYLGRVDSWPPANVNITDEDVAIIQGSGATVANLLPERRGAVLKRIQEREMADQDTFRRETHERWKRKQFYTDEEEGATKPVDWDEEEDILAQSGIGEISKSQSQSRPSIHSRSSSKVRFAEDMDDFDTRSNPSTSSRSVPERWGDMKIPDAERDAGKEILYQVTQQAFNELLDPLFKAKEDLALEAASSKAERVRHRERFSTPEFVDWATKRARNGSKSPLNNTPIAQRPGSDVDRVPERPLEELLADSGYRIAPDPDVLNSPNHVEALEAAELGAARLLAEHHARSPTSMGEDHYQSIHSRLQERRRSRAQGQSESSSAVDESHPSWESTAEQSSSPWTIIERDPTMPQFRPNSLPTINTQFSPQFTPSGPQFFMFDPSEDGPVLQRPASSVASIIGNPSDTNANSVSSQDHGNQDHAHEDEIDDEVLYRLWTAEMAVMEAKEREGWGRLNVQEFEALVKKCIGEGKGNKMDYLGSWIEHCLP